jgi:predicted nucleic acid-binding protein
LVTDVVIDASAGVRAAITSGWAGLKGLRLTSPTLFWSEAAAGIRQLTFRNEITPGQAGEAIARLIAAPINAHSSLGLIAEAQDLAGELGWTKTYNAEYIVLARRLGVPLLTLDARLASTAKRFVDLLI